MISVIIPSYNSEHTISDCLMSIELQTYSCAPEIIVVDSSDDKTSGIVISRFPSVRLVRLEKRTDPGTARNIGIGKARGDLIAFIDADCVAASDWLERMASAHESSYAAVGGIVKNSPASDNSVGRAGYLAEFREFLPGGRRQEVRHIPACNISYKINVFRKYGFFQGEYYPQEDLIFNYRLWESGERILLDPTIQVWHQHRSDLNPFLRHQYLIGKATSRVLRTIPLKGAFIARRPLLAVCLIPFLTAVKFVRTIQVFLRYQPEFIWERLPVLPVFALGLIAWAIGFAASAYAEMPIAREQARSVKAE